MSLIRLRGPAGSGAAGDSPGAGWQAGQQTAGKKKADKSSDAALTWQQRALQLLSKLQTAKGFKELPPKLKAEVTALIDDAPNDAYS